MLQRPVSYSRRQNPRIETREGVSVYWSCGGRDDTSRVLNLSNHPHPEPQMPRVCSTELLGGRARENPAAEEVFFLEIRVLRIYQASECEIGKCHDVVERRLERTAKDETERQTPDNSFTSLIDDFARRVSSLATK